MEVHPAKGNVKNLSSWLKRLMFEFLLSTEAYFVLRALLAMSDPSVPKAYKDNEVQWFVSRKRKLDFTNFLLV